MDPMGVKGRRGSKVHGFQRSNKSKVSANFKGSRASGLLPARFMASRVQYVKAFKNFNGPKASGVKD